MRLEISDERLPDLYWQSMPCPKCGVGIGEKCRYSSVRESHTRHADRDEAVIRAAETDVLRAAAVRLEGPRV